MDCFSDKVNLIWLRPMLLAQRAEHAGGYFRVIRAEQSRSGTTSRLERSRSQAADASRARPYLITANERA